MLDVIDCFEEQTRRKNEGAPPPICPMELSKLKAMMEARIQDANRETVVRHYVLSVAASLEVGPQEAAAGVLAVTPTATARAGSITSPVVPDG